MRGSVSIVVRLHGREPAPILRSLGELRPAPLEVLLVGGCAGTHEAAHRLARELGLPLHPMDGTRPDAASLNRALERVRGEYFCVMDETARCAPQYLGVLLQAAAARPDALAWYVRSHVADVAHGTAQVFGRAFNPALFHYDRLFELAATLISRHALVRGCRFDEALDDGAQDFLQQVSAQGSIAFVAEAPPPIDVLRATPAPHAGRRIVLEQRQWAKWSGPRQYHSLHSTLLCTQAGARLDAGDVAGALAGFEATLAQYPGDPLALHGLARCELARHRPVAAMQHVLAALEMDPDNAEFRATAGRLRRLLVGNVVLDNRPFALASWSMAPQPLPPRPPVAQAAAHGDAPCPCGSSVRHIHCCGKHPAGACNLARALDNAHAHARRGEAAHAAAILHAVVPESIHDAAQASRAGELCLAQHLLEPALALLQRALDLDPQCASASEACRHAADLYWRQLAWRSAADVLRPLLERIQQRARTRHAAPPPGPLHVVGQLNALGGSERRALNLYQQMASRRPTLLWSTVAPLALHAIEAPIRHIGVDQAPAGGTLVLAGSYFHCDDWLARAPFERVVICHNLSEQWASLMEKLVQLELNPSRPHVELVFPSRLFRELSGLPGTIEYSAVDVDVFRRSSPREDRRSLVVGRHGRAHRLKFHPDDPAFFRAVLARGHSVRLLGGSAIAAAFAGDATLPELLQPGAESARDFLESLDVFVYRKHPAFIETGGTVILEAMAMALPVIVFPQDCGVAELIRHEVDGLLVHDEHEALAALDRLATDPLLRRRLGLAARHTVVELLRRQDEELQRRYAGAVVARESPLSG